MPPVECVYYEGGQNEQVTMHVLPVQLATQPPFHSTVVFAVE